MGIYLDRNRKVKYDSSLVFRFPVWIWYRQAYEISQDGLTTGWWSFQILLSLDEGYASRGLNLRWGWVVLSANKQDYAI